MAKLLTQAERYKLLLRQGDGRFHIFFQLWRNLRTWIHLRRFAFYYLGYAIWHEGRSFPARIQFLRTKKLIRAGLPAYSKSFPNVQGSIPERVLFQKIETARNLHILDLAAIFPRATLVDFHHFLVGWDKGAEWGIAQRIEHSGIEQLVAANSSAVEYSHAETDYGR